MSTEASNSPVSQSASGSGATAATTRAVAARRRRRVGFRQAQRRRRRRPAVLSLNLTAMIDTVFNLLFFFMVASRFGAIEGLLSANLPAKASTTAAPAVEVPRTPLRIRLVQDARPAGTCRATIDVFESTPIEMAALPAALAKIRTTEGFDDRHVPVYLLAGDDVAWDHVVNAYNAAMAAQYERVFFGGAP